MEKDDLPHNGIQILLDEDERIPQDHFIDSFQVFKVCIVDPNPELTGEELRIPGAICTDIFPGFFYYLCVVHDWHSADTSPLEFIQIIPSGSLSHKHTF